MMRCMSFASSYGSVRCQNDDGRSVCVMSVTENDISWGTSVPAAVGVVLRCNRIMYGLVLSGESGR